jgi:flagellar hook-associated protein 2
MAIASSGIISGLDVANLVKASMVYERLPLERLEKQLSTTESKISAMGQIKSAISSLQEAAKAISNSGDLYSYKASLSNANVATATASGKAAAGSYKIEVDQLATSHKLASAGGLDVSAGGSLTIELGKVKSGSFVAKDGTTDGSSAISVEIKAGASLSDVAKAINDSGAGVSATVVNGTDGAQLVLTSKETGENNRIKLLGLGLDFDPGDPAANANMTQPMEQDEEGALNAKVKIDGITLANTTSNTIKDALTGVDLTLKAAGNTQLTVSSDSADLETKLKTFVDAYNKARNTMKDLSSYDAAEKSAAVLNGDSAVTSAMNQLRGLLSTVPGELLSAGPEGVSKAYQSLANLGVETSGAGVLSLDTSKLKSAMETDFTSVAKAVAAYGSEFDKLTTQMNKSDGLIANRLDGLNSTTSRLKDNISTEERRVALVQARYEKQYANLETLLSSLTTTSNYLTQQLESLKKLSG